MESSTMTYEQRRAAEQAEADQYRAEMEQLIRDVCAKLATVDTWTIKTWEPGEYDRRLPSIAHPDGRMIEFGSGKSGPPRIARQKVHISGGWPLYRTPGHGPQYMSPYQVGADSPSIEVTRDRGADVIAREIIRRFLPNYTETWKKCQARIEATVGYANGVQGAYRQLCEALGIQPSAKAGDVETPTISVSPLGIDGYGDITPYKDSAEIRLRSIPLETALEVCRLLRAIRERQPAKTEPE